MNRPRIPLGLESSRATLNLDVCAQLGRELAAARAQLGLDTRDVAARLLLSPCQVSGLEQADAEAFYSAELYLVAARKYDALVGAGSPLLDDVLVRPDPELKVAAAARPFSFTAPSLRGMRPWLAAAAVLAVSGMVGWYVVSRGWPVSGAVGDAHVSAPPSLSHFVSASIPMPRAEVRLVAPAVRPVLTPAVARPSGSEQYGHVQVERATWVFVRYQDNSTVERVLEPGQRFVLQAAPVYIAAGAASGAEVVLDGERVDVARFDVNGQLRIGSAFLSAALR